MNFDKTESHKAKTLTHTDLVSGYIEIQLGKTISNNHIFICDTSKQTSDLNIKLFLVYFLKQQPESCPVYYLILLKSDHIF